MSIRSLADFMEEAQTSYGPDSPDPLGAMPWPSPLRGPQRTWAIPTAAIPPPKGSTEQTRQPPPAPPIGSGPKE